MRKTMCVLWTIIGMFLTLCLLSPATADSPAARPEEITGLTPTSTALTPTPVIFPFEGTPTPEPSPGPELAYGLWISVDRGEGATYRTCEPIQICYDVPYPVYIQIYVNTLECGKVIAEGYDDGYGGCLWRAAGLPTGNHWLSIEMIEGGHVTDSASTWFYVGDSGSASAQIWPDRGEGATYRIGDPIQLGFWVNRPAYVEIWKTTSQGSALLDYGYATQAGNWYLDWGVIGEPPGTHYYSLDVYECVLCGSSWRLTWDETWVNVEEVDTDPPSIYNVVESNDPINKQGCPSPTTVEIGAGITDSSGVAWARLYYKLNSGSWSYKTMSHTGSSYYATLGPFSEVGTVYYYVKARDNVGNESDSLTYTVTVNDCDVSPPYISNVVESNDPICKQGTGSPDTVNISAQITDDPSGVAWAKLYYRLNYGSWSYRTMSHSDSTYSATIGPFSETGTIEYYIKARDNAGNERDSLTYTVTVQNCVTEAEIELTGLEVTQAIQNWENSVVLIKGRPTLVRAHIRSTSGTVNDVTAKLIGRRNGSELPDSPLRPANGGGNIDVLENPNRSQLNDSFYFELPESWRSGTVELEFRGVSHSLACREHAGTDNDCKVQVTFAESPAADVRLVGVIWRENGTKHQPTWGDIYEVVQEIESTFPIPQLDWDSPYDIEPALFAGQPSAVWQFNRLNMMLKINRTLDGCISSWPVNCKRYYLGILVDPPSSGVAGMADDIPADVATAYLTNKFTPSHELGHCADRYHTTCRGDEAGPGPYPYPGGRISWDNSGDNAFYGFDINTKRIYGPDTGDLMSYCGPPRWPSDWTYSHIRDHLVSRYGTSSFSLALMAGEPAVLVSGVVTPTDGTGILESVFNVESPASVPAPDPGTYAIRFEDSRGQELASYSFEPAFGVDFRVGCADGGEDAVGTFALLLPWDSSTAHIVLLRDSQELDSRPASANAPTVTVISPNGGESLSGSTATLSWFASDLDGDPLEYVVQYSTDGGTNWQTLVSAWPSTSYELNLDAIAGTDQGLLRVLASDGFHTAQDQADGTFTVAKHLPHANIQAPENNSLFVGNQTIILEGSAYDNEDGQLGDAALSWSSNLDGALGTGRSLAVVASTLTEGTHTITLTAQDSDGQTDTANITVQVYRERPTLPTSLAVAPAALSFVAVEGGEQTAWQTLSIRNEGDGTMTWSAAVDQSWILVSSLGGTAPTDIIVATNPTGLSAGEYTGNITITASGAANSPQIIEVTLSVREPYMVYLPLILRQY